MLKMAIPLLLVKATSLIMDSSDVVMLGLLSNPEQVGVYSVAARLALLGTFFLHVTNSAISPKLASLFANGQMEEMERMVKTVTAMLIVVATVFILMCIFFGKTVLGLWGSGFSEAYFVLVILSFGQFLNISTGCSGLLLIMCGHERVHSWISVVAVLVNVVLNYIFITYYGAVGAAIATAANYRRRESGKNDLRQKENRRSYYSLLNSMESL